MRGGQVLQGKGGAEREADHDPDGHDEQPRPVPSRRQALPPGHEQQSREDGRDEGAPEADDDAPQGRVGRARRREGEAEAEYAQAAQEHAVRRPPPIHRRHTRLPSWYAIERLQ